MSCEIEAAQIAANAAIQAARIQGEWTLAAGIIAFFGGLLALFGAFLAARRQVRLEERRHKALAAAYRIRMMEIAVNIANHAFMNDVHTKNNPDTIRIEPFAIPKELDSLNWRDHAMLGDIAVTAISSLYEMAKTFDEFALEMHGKPAETNSETFGDKRAIDSYRHLNKALRDRAGKLLAILKPEGQGG